VLSVSAAGIALSLASGFSYAIHDYLRKVVSEDIGPALLLLIIVLGQIPVLGLFWAVAGETEFTNGYWLPGVADAAAGLTANILFLKAIKVSPLSLTIPLLSLTPVFTLVLGAVILGETTTIYQTIGVVIVTLGVFVLYIPDQRGAGVGAVVKNFFKEPGAPLMLGTAVLWSLTAPLDKAAMEHASVAVHGMLQMVIIASVLVVYLLWKGALKPSALPQRRYGILALTLLSGGLAYGFMLAAFTVTFVGIVEALKRVIGQVSALVIGRIMLHEPLSGPKIAGVALMSIGVPLIVLSF